jgi:hypothetical protein
MMRAPPEIQIHGGSIQEFQEFNLMTKKRAHHGHGWTPSDLKKLKSLVAKGTPRADIAQVLGRTVSAVYQRIVTEQMSPRRRRAKRRGR